MDKTELFERMPVRIAVRKQIVPAIISQMVTLIYNLADTYFVGLLNDPAQTAAVAVAAPIFLMLTAISNLFGVGGASTFAQALGRKENKTASQISSIAFWFGLLASVLFAFAVFVFMRPILIICGATNEVYELVRSYVMWTVIIGGPGTVLNILLANLIRGEGSAGIASFGVSAGGFLNILLDPFFVLPRFLNMGAAGAGLATAISNLTTTLFFLAYIFSSKNKTLLSVSPSHLRYARERIGLILSIGFPSAVQYALTVVAVAASIRIRHGGGGGVRHHKENRSAAAVLFHRRGKRPAAAAGVQLCGRQPRTAEAGVSIRMRDCSGFFRTVSDCL